MEEDNYLNNEMSDFMQSQTEEKIKETKKNEIEEKVDKLKNDKEKKDLDDAKKNSKYNTSKYVGLQANLIRAQSRQFIMMLPFLVVGLIILMLLLLNGGDWLRGGIYFGIKKMRGE